MKQTGGGEKCIRTFLRRQTEKVNATLCPKIRSSVPTLLTCQARAAASLLFVIPAKGLP